LSWCRTMLGDDRAALACGSVPDDEGGDAPTAEAATAATVATTTDDDDDDDSAASVLIVLTLAATAMRLAAGFACDTTACTATEVSVGGQMSLLRPSRLRPRPCDGEMAEELAPGRSRLVMTRSCWSFAGKVCCDADVGDSPPTGEEDPLSSLSSVSESRWCCCFWEKRAAASASIADDDRGESGPPGTTSVNADMCNPQDRNAALVFSFLFVPGQRTRPALAFPTGW
jgi:hypothetical protein